MNWKDLKGRLSDLKYYYDKHYKKSDDTQEDSMLKDDGTKENESFEKEMNSTSHINVNQNNESDISKKETETELKEAFVPDFEPENETKNDWITSDIYHWIRLGTEDEVDDVKFFANVIFNAYQKKEHIESFWIEAGVSFLTSYFLHYGYFHRLNTITDMDKDIMIPSLELRSLQSNLLGKPSVLNKYSIFRQMDSVLDDMEKNAEIGYREALNLPVEQGLYGEYYVNILQKLYREYIEPYKFIYFEQEIGFPLRSLRDIQKALRHMDEMHADIDWKNTEKPYHLLLKHPEVQSFVDKINRASMPTKTAIYSLVCEAIRHFVCDVEIVNKVPSCQYNLYLSWRDENNTLCLLLGDNVGKIFFVRVPKGHEPHPSNEENMKHHPEDCVVIVSDNKWRYNCTKWYGDSDNWPYLFY